MTASMLQDSRKQAPTAPLRVGVVARDDDPLSVRGYRAALLRELPALGVEPVAFAGDAPARLDVLWDPGLGMRRVPRLLQRTDLPVVATVHGLRAHSLPLAEAAAGFRDRLRTAMTMAAVRRDWRRLGTRVAAVIAVSRFGADEAVAALGLPASRVFPIHHGVDHAVFGPVGSRAARARPFFLMVTQYQPKKNVDRVLGAYATLPESGRPDLVVVAPGLRRRGLPAGVEVVREALAPTELAALYRAAVAFVCPSLHETFGMPLVEAMGCGCPVLTSDTTACPEVAGDAAVLVDPRDERAIAAALARLADDAGLRTELAERGRQRAVGFTWRECARRHRDVLRRAAEVRA